MTWAVPVGFSSSWGHGLPLAFRLTASLAAGIVPADVGFPPIPVPGSASPRLPASLGGHVVSRPASSFLFCAH